MARPRKQVDLEKLRNLALIGCTNMKIAKALGISHDTLQRRYLPLIEEVRSDGETRILAKTFEKATSGCMRALELSLVNRCGWANRPEVMVQVTQNTLALDTRSPEAVKAHLVELQKAVMKEAKRFELNENGNEI